MSQTIQYARNNIVTGIFIAIPVAVSVFVIDFIYEKLTSWSWNIIAKFETVEKLSRHIMFFDHLVRIAALLFILITLFFLGVAARNVFGRRILDFLEGLMMKVPMFNSVYATTRHIIDAIRSQNSAMFSKAVLFQYPRPGIYTVGFVTNENRGNWEIGARTGREMFSVFLPTTPNPTGGFLLLIPKEELIFLDLPVQDAMRMIISCGAISPLPWTGTPPAIPIANNQTKGEKT